MQINVTNVTMTLIIQVFLLKYAQLRNLGNLKKALYGAPSAVDVTCELPPTGQKLGKTHLDFEVQSNLRASPHSGDGCKRKHEWDICSELVGFCGSPQSPCH